MTQTRAATSPNRQRPVAPPAAVRPPNTHQLAAMIWLAVFPTLTTLNLAFGDWLRAMSPVLRTFVLATTAVPIVVYGVMPQLHRLRRLVLTRRGRTATRAENFPR